MLLIHGNRVFNLFITLTRIEIMHITLPYLLLLILLLMWWLLLLLLLQLLLVGLMTFLIDDDANLMTHLILLNLLLYLPINSSFLLQQIINLNVLLLIIRVVDTLQCSLNCCCCGCVSLQPICNWVSFPGYLIWDDVLVDGGGRLSIFLWGEYHRTRPWI